MAMHVTGMIVSNILHPPHWYALPYDVQLLEKWFEVVGISPQGAMKDLNLYQEQVGKVEQAELVSPVTLQFIHVFF